jgi:hypothetical protein
MTKRSHLPLVRWLLLVILPLSVAHAAPWPDGYIIHEGSASPDGRYGIAVPGTYDDGDDSETVNYLADIKSHQLLGKIDDSDYFEHKNHARLEVSWAPTSDCCTLVYDSRFGFDTIYVLELTGSGFKQTDLGKHIEEFLIAAAGEEGNGSAFFRFASGRKVLVRALYYTGNPKMQDESTHYSRFEGTYDLNTGKWIKSAGRKTTNWDALIDAYSDYTGRDVYVCPPGSKVPDDFTGQIVSSDDEKASYLDHRMNSVYQGVRTILPSDRFEKVKKDQIAWLKKRDAATSVAEKCNLMEARIKALQDLLW